MWGAVPTNWERLGYPPAGTTIDLHVALKSYDEDALIYALYEVSDPEHPKYGAHLSKEQVAKLVAPHPYTLELVNSWIEYNGVPPSSISITHGGSWLTLTGVPISQANELLGASYELHRHTRTNETIIRTVSYALPAVLHPHVETVAPTTFFASTHTLQQIPRRPSVRAAAAQENAASGNPVKALSSREDDLVTVTPANLRWLYKTFTYVPAATDRNKLGIAGYLNEYPNQTDLTTFMTEFREDAKAASYTVVQVNGGGYNQSQPGYEASLNVQYASAMAYPTPLVYYSNGGETKVFPDGKPAPGDVILEWLKYVLQEPNVPQTISTSYGTDEKDCPREYAKALCKLFLQLGARGVSLLFGSGDDGVGAGDCKGEDGKVRFIPVFPASCPWVTSVGGTKLFPEEAVPFSGGGFSDIFPRPKYQNKIVPAYLRKFGRRKYARLYNPAGRGIPDIAAQALNFVIVVNDTFGPTKGTSCAAPTVAGIISLLNDFQLSRGKKALGFLNPLLYDKGVNGLNDIISGSNPGCNTDGFSAIAGWDPVRPARLVFLSELTDFWTS
ncbi:subtilisin-like protein [Lactarius indigo]|nr:subtilisin-like protein [Lactarius indigo]